MSFTDFLTNYFKPSSGVIVEWIVLALILIFCLVCARGLKDRPGKRQNLAEMVVEKLYNYFYDLLGKNTDFIFPILATFFVFIIVCNYTGELPFAGVGFEVPTSLLGTALALGIISFCTIHICGFKKRGFKKYLGSFLKPVAVLLPITILEQIIRPISLSLRLYGNLYGEDQVTNQLFNLIPIALPWIMNVLSLLFCLIQAMIFTMLTAIFIGEAIEDDEEEEKEKQIKQFKEIQKNTETIKEVN